MIDEINAEQEKSDRLTVAKLNAVKQFNKQDHKSKIMTEKYSLLLHDPDSCNCAVFVLYTVSIVLSFTSRV